MQDQKPLRNLLELAGAVFSMARCSLSFSCATVSIKSLYQLTVMLTGDVQCSIPLQSPVNFSFDPHDGSVHSIESSPYHRNLFLTCASDCTARIYSMLQACRAQSSEVSLMFVWWWWWWWWWWCTFLIRMLECTTDISEMVVVHSNIRVRKLQILMSCMRQFLFAGNSNHLKVITGCGSWKWCKQTFYLVLPSMTL